MLRKPWWNAYIAHSKPFDGLGVTFCFRGKQLRKYLRIIAVYTNHLRNDCGATWLPVLHSFAWWSDGWMWMDWKTKCTCKKKRHLKKRDMGVKVGAAEGGIYISCLWHAPSVFRQHPTGWRWAAPIPKTTRVASQEYAMKWNKIGKIQERTRLIRL